MRSKNGKKDEMKRKMKRKSWDMMDRKSWDMIEKRKIKIKTE